MNHNTKNTVNEILRISGVDVAKCMRCGKCSATCPSYDEMNYHPHQFVYMIERGEVAPLLEDASIYHCLSCFACAERCPRGVEPVKLIEAVRLIALREKGKNHLTPNDIPALLDEDMPQQTLMSAFRKYSK